MAAPGYPQMGQMQQPGMGGPQMGGPQMGGPPMQMQRPIRRGTSKAVPVVVSAGLAVGVFCGLLFGVGTGNKDAVAAPSGNNVKKEEAEAKPEPGAAPAGLGATKAQPVAKPAAGSAAVAATGSATPAGSGSPPAVAAAGSAAAPAAGAGVGSAKPAVEEKKVIKLTFKLKPESAEKDAKITIDGKDITGLAAEIPGDTKSMKVEIKANGFRTLEKKQDIVVAPGEEMQIEFELQKKPSGGTGGGVRPPKRPDRPTNAGGGGGGLIDI